MLLSGALVVSARSQDETTPRPLPGNVSPEYPEGAMEKAVAGTVAFRATVTPEGNVASVHILRVPLRGLGFEQSTRRAVMTWRFEPGRAEGAPIESTFVGSAGFRLRPEDEEAIELVVQGAFENWSRPPPLGPVEKVKRIEVRDESAGPSSMLEKRLTESYGPAGGSAQELAVEAIQFEGDDAWVTTLLREAPSSGPAERFRTLMVHRHDRWYAFLSEDPGLVPRVMPGEGQRYTTEPVVQKKPPNPAYPRQAVKNRIGGEVILHIAVELDGSTTVLRLVKSLPYCNVAAIENAWKWRWTPAVRDGEPIRALGIITVSFNIVKERG